MIMKGTVKWFSRAKGYGFITADDEDSSDGQEIFVHYSAIEGDGYRNLQEGDRVRFRLVDVGKGPQAQDVRRINALRTASEMAS